MIHEYENQSFIFFFSPGNFGCLFESWLIRCGGNRSCMIGPSTFTASRKK
jgi:hypothetical protein